MDTNRGGRGHGHVGTKPDPTSKPKGPPNNQDCPTPATTAPGRLNGEFLWHRQRPQAARAHDVGPMHARSRTVPSTRNPRKHRKTSDIHGLHSKLRPILGVHCNNGGPKNHHHDSHARQFLFTKTSHKCLSRHSPSIYRGQTGHKGTHSHLPTSSSSKGVAMVCRQGIRGHPILLGTLCQPCYPRNVVEADGGDGGHQGIIPPCPTQCLRQTSTRPKHAGYAGRCPIYHQ